MVGELVFRIPENFDIEGIVKQNKELFYRNGLNEHKILYLCDALLDSRAKQRKYLNEKENNMSSLSSKRLKKVVHDYKKHIDFLVSQKIFLTDNQFILGEKCIGYCFNTPYAGQKIKNVKVNNYRLKKAIRQASEDAEKNRLKSVKGYSYLINWWDCGKLKIDDKKAYAWIDEYEKEKIKAINNGTLKLKKSGKLAPAIAKQVLIDRAIETTEDFKYLVDRINYKKPHYSFRGHGHRFYNPISMLKKELRDFLTYDGQPLVDIDIKNSQPFFSIALFQPLFWKTKTPKKLGKLSLEGISKEIYSKVRGSNKYKDIITLLKTSTTQACKGSSFSEFSHLVANGVFYEYIQKHFEGIYPTRFNSRQNVKKEVLRILYVSNNRLNVPFYKPCQIFGNHFPEAQTLFKYIKDVQSNYLPIILQRIESFLVLDIICKAISVKHPQIPLFTIHDNIITTKGNEGVVKAIMSQELEKWIGYKPVLDSSDLVPSKISPRIRYFKTGAKSLPLFNLFINNLLGCNGINSLCNQSIRVP